MLHQYAAKIITKPAIGICQALSAGIFPAKGKYIIDITTKAGNTTSPKNHNNQLQKQVGYFKTKIGFLKNNKPRAARGLYGLIVRIVESAFV